MPGTTTANSFTTAKAASADGSVIVGFGANATNNATFSAERNRAWHWTAATGLQDLNVLATNAGLNLNGFVLLEAVGISDNGQFITGTASRGPLDAIGDPQFQNAYVLQVVRVNPVPTTLSTTAQLIVTLRLPGVTQTSIVNQSFSTQVDALLNGGNVFTRNVNESITGPGGVTALADARTALSRNSGLRRVIIGAPTLVSNATTVLSTTNSTVDVASGTTTTTAVVNTAGPATVATGNLGTCATAAINGVNPTGCSLPGTPVTVNAGVTGINTFTNTINSVTPTTTPTVNQLVLARWQVSATAGNQFATVHALAGVAAFDRGDRLIGQLIGMAGSSRAAGANAVVRAAMPMRNANRASRNSGGLTMFGGYFGSWSTIDADSSVPVASTRGNTNGFVLGLEKQLGDARLGVAVDYGISDYDVRDPQYAEALNFKTTQISLFGGWHSGGFRLNGAAAYGFGTARTTIQTPTTPATGNRDIRSWSLGAQAGYTVPLGKNASIELVGGVRHVSARLDRFTEVGGPTPLIGLDQTASRTRLYAGLEVEGKVDASGLTVTPRAHARIARDSGSARGTADLVFATTPTGPTMTALGADLGNTVAELGGSLDAAASDKVHLWFGYDGTFRNGSTAHAVRAGLTVAL